MRGFYPVEIFNERQAIKFWHSSIHRVNAQAFLNCIYLFVLIKLYE